jgi:glycosyltransferase involved in cell wall biosynthesis
MTDQLAWGGPLLSICVPTFNRAQALRNLLRNLALVKRRFGDRVEVCISNNASTDDTAAAIAEFEAVLHPRVQHQASNIGGTLNIIAVAQLGSGRFSMLVGDDDELLPDNLAGLLDLLPDLGEHDWVLAGVASPQGEEQLLGDLPPGRHEKRGFRRQILRTSLHRYGFMGMHVFPAAARATLATLTLETAQPWPHIAAFLRRLDDGGTVHVFKPPVMIQAQGGAKLFWNAGDLARITLSKLRILHHADAALPGHHAFHRALMLRELYSVPNLGLLIAWKLYEPADFDARALPAYHEGWLRTGAWLPLALPHVLATVALRLLPQALLGFFFKLAGRGHFIDRYAQRKQELQAFDGIKRGI